VCCYQPARGILLAAAEGKISAATLPSLAPQCGCPWKTVVGRIVAGVWFSRSHANIPFVNFVRVLLLNTIYPLSVIIYYISCTRC
jgi:hypothetical protein